MKATPEREPSARAVVLGLLAMAMTTGLACLVPIFAMYRGGSRADTIAFLVGAWLSTSTLVGLTGGLTLRFKPTLVILKSLCVAGFLGALNGSIVVALMLAQRAAVPYLGAALSVAAMVGGVLGLIVGLFVQLPLHGFRKVLERPTRTPGSSVFVAVSGGIAAQCVLLAFGGIWQVTPGIVAAGCSSFLLLVFGYARREQLRRRGRGDRPGFERVPAAEIDVPGDLLPLHDGVSESPTHVLVRVSSLETGPFRDAPARVPYAWVDG